MFGKLAAIALISTTQASIFDEQFDLELATLADAPAEMWQEIRDMDWAQMDFNGGNNTGDGAEALMNDWLHALLHQIKGMEADNTKKQGENEAAQKKLDDMAKAKTNIRQVLEKWGKTFNEVNDPLKLVNSRFVENK